MKKIILIVTILGSMMFSGCNFSPLSPNLNQKINNQDGKIDELKNNQNGLMLEFGKVKQSLDITARDVKNIQEGAVNIRGTDNYGVQIFSGDGGILMGFGIIVTVIGLTFYYRNRAVKSEKTCGILAQQVAAHNDVDLENKIFLAALNTNVEKDVYHLMIKHQSVSGRN